MNIKEELTHETLIQQVSKKLLAARQEIDEFVVQLALGKAEGKEKFELLKREFSTRLQEWKKSFSTDAMENELKEKITALETQLEQAKAEEVKPFEAQIKKILSALVAIESHIRKKIGTTAHQISFDNEVEMFKLKLEIIRLRLGLKKFEVKEEFREGMNEAIKKIESITTTASEKFMEGKEKVKSFKGEIQLAYKHFGQALKKLR